MPAISSARSALVLLLLAACGDFRIAPPPARVPFDVQPATAAAGPLETLTFSLTGGHPPYRAQLETAGSGSLARVEAGAAGTFRYQAGSNGNQLDVLSFCDAAECRTVEIRVGPPLTVKPESAHLAFGATLTLQISGGVVPYEVKAQHGAVEGFRYTAPPATEELRSDQLLVTDATGTGRTVVVTLVRPLEALTFQARPGETLLLDQLMNSRVAGLPPYSFRWDPQGNGSGGTLTWATYSAGENADTTDRLLVTDAAGQEGVLSIAVGSPEFPLQERILIPGDFDGNGWTDLVALTRGLEPRTAFIASSLRSAPRLVRDDPSSDQHSILERPTAIDVNGDGADELVGIVNDSFERLLAVWGGAPGGPLGIVQTLRLTGIEPSDPVAVDATGDGRPEVVALFNHSENPRPGELCPPSSVVIFRRNGAALSFWQCVTTPLDSNASVRLFAGRFDWSSPHDSIGFFDAPGGAQAWLGFLDYDETSESFSFPSRPVRTADIPPYSELVGAGDFDGDQFDEVVLLSRGAQPRALLVSPFCLDPQTCELRADEPVHALELTGLAARPTAFVGALSGRAELLVGAPGATELRVWGFGKSGWDAQSRTLPLRVRLPVEFDITTADLDTDDRPDLIVAGASVSVQFGDGRGGVNPGDRWRVPGAKAMAGLPGSSRALVAGRQLQVLGGAHGQLFYADQAPLSGSLLFPGKAPVSTADGEVLVPTDDGLVRARLVREAGVERLQVRRGTLPDLQGLTVLRRGMGAFPMLVTDAVESQAQGDFVARTLRLDDAGLVAMPDFVARAGSVRHTPLLLGDFGARDGVPDLLVSPSSSPSDPLIFYPGALAGGALSFAQTPQTVAQLPATGELSYLDAQWLALEHGAAAPERLVLLAIDRAGTGESSVVVHVTGANPKTTRLASRNSEPTLLVGRLDADAFTDLVLVNDSAATAFLYGDGQGGFTAGCRTVGFSPRDGWLVDANGDGLDDLAVYDPVLESVLLVRNEGRILEPCR